MRAYLAGVSLTTFARGNRRMLAAVKARRAQRAKQAKKAARKAAEKAQKAQKAQKPGEKPGEQPDSPAAETRRTVPVWERVAWSAGGVFLLWPTIGPAVPVTLGTLVAVWVVAALIAGQEEESGPADTATDSPVPDADADTAQKGDRAAPAAPTEADRARFAEALLRTVEYAVSTAKAEGRTGVHLSTLAQAIHATGAALPTDDQLAALLPSLGVPVTGLTLGPKTARINRRGVRFDQLSEALGRTPRQDPATAAAMAVDLTAAGSVA